MTMGIQVLGSRRRIGRCSEELYLDWQAKKPESGRGLGISTMQPQILWMRHDKMGSNDIRNVTLP